MFYYFNEIYKILPKKLQEELTRKNLDLKDVCEIRLRINCQVILYERHNEIILDTIIDEIMLNESLERISNYSKYAYEEQLKQGFITIKGGHRVGVAGKLVCQGDVVHAVKNISSINIRLAHEVLGCSEKVLEYLYENGWCNTLIVSPPACGKTTILRDIIYHISDGFNEIKGINVGVVDERGEIAACHLGIPQNKLGKRTDILDGCSKNVGMMMLLRSMSPRVIAVDELGGEKDIDIIKYIINCGCKIICTLHGEDYGKIIKKQYLKDLLETRIFQRIVYIKLGEDRKILWIEDGEGKKILDEVVWY